MRRGPFAEDHSYSTKDVPVQDLHDHDPRRVGPYQLLGLLGGGGMGRVYLALGPRGPVALKVVHPWLATDEQFRSRFAREVAAGRRIRSPWTAAVLDADADGRVPWLATEYVHGVPLDRAVRTAGPLSPAAVHVLAADMARALAAVHAAGLVHRDVKPGNVMLSGDRSVLIDFGITRALDATQLTGTGVAIGTPAFMSPEQAEGLELGTASDLFSLASVLVYAATGTGPFGGDTPLAVMGRIRKDEPDLGLLAEPVRSLVIPCFARDPDARPTADALAAALARHSPATRQSWLPPRVAALVPPLPALVQATVVLREGDLDPPTPAPARRTSRRALLVAGGVLGLAAMGGAAWLATERGEPRVRWTAVPSIPTAWMALGDGAVHVAGHNVPSSDTRVNVLDQVTGEVEWSYTVPAPPSAARLVVDGNVTVGHEGRIIVVDGGTGVVRWSADRRLFGAGNGIVLGATSRDTGVALQAFDAPTGAPRWEIQLLGPSSGSWRTAIGFGRLVVAAGQRVDAFESATGRQLWQHGASRPVDYVGGTADIVFYRDLDGSRVTVLDAATGAPRWNWSDPAAVVESASIHEGSLVLSSRTGLVVRDLLTGEERWRIGEADWPDDWPGGVGTTVAFVDGRCYFGDNHGPGAREFRLVALDVATGDTVWTLALPPVLQGVVLGPMPLMAVPGSVFVGGRNAVHAVAEP